MLKRNIDSDEVYLLLLDKTQNKKEQGLRLLLKTYEPKWRAFLYRYKAILQEDDQDLVISETSLKIYKNIESYNEKKSSFQWWIFIILRNVVNDYLKAAKNGKNFINIDENQWEEITFIPQTTREEIDKNQQTNILKFFKELSSIEQDVLRMSAEDIEPREIAMILNISPGYARVIKSRAIEKMKSKINN